MKNTDNLGQDDVVKKWMEGEEIDWSQLQQDKSVKKLKLPKTFFQEKSTYESYSMKEKILSVIADLLKMKVSDLQEDKAFADIGVDSICGVDLVEQINEKFGLDLSVTIIYDYPRTLEFTDYVLKQYEKAAPNSETKLQSEMPQEEKDYQKETIAIVGASGRFADSDNLEELWEHLANGDNLVTPVERWNLPSVDEEENPVCHNGSLLSRLDSFDPLFFNISGLEATYMDPQQRIFLEECWNALEDAGCAGTLSGGEKAGVYVASTTGDYQERFSKDVPAQALWGNMNSIVPSRIAYFLNLKGPAITVDTACSSSLVAVHLACQGLWMKETDIALAGGVSLQCTPKMYRAGNKGNMLSPSGYCHTFDSAADGFVPGEGAAVIVLKRLQDAIDDNDHIYGVIVGSGINQDGASNGITAPSTISQTELERGIYEKFKIQPEDIQMIENHGTGTIVGDPIEFQALTNAFRNFTEKKNFCALGSIKTNIGHTQHTSGAAGIIKVILALKHAQIPPSLHFNVGNPNINFQDSPFYVNTELKKWNAVPGHKRMAAVSAFGFGGTNAHVVIEEAPIIEKRHGMEKPYMIALSAMSKEQLMIQVKNMINYCKRNIDVDCGNLSYTLMKGRKHFNYRLAFMAREGKEIISLLTNWLANSGQSKHVFCGESKRKGITKLTMNMGEAELEAYVNGGQIDCSKMFAGEQYTKLSLPNYPFRKDSYWVLEQGENSILCCQRKNEDITENGKLINTVHLTGEEFYLKYHEVAGKKILPGSAYLEMARKCICNSIVQKESQIVLQDIIWLKPVSLENGSVDVIVEIKENQTGQMEFEIYTRSDSLSEKNLHCQGKYQVNLSETREFINEKQLTENLIKCQFDRNDFYHVLKDAGIQYGEPFQCVKEVLKREQDVLVHLELSQAYENTTKQFILHPSLLDAAFQSISLVENTVEELKTVKPALLFSIGELKICNSFSSSMWALITKSKKNTVKNHDMILFDEKKNICAVINHISSREVKDILNKDVRKDNKGEEISKTAKVKWLIPRWMPEEPVMESRKKYRGTLLFGGSSEQKKVFETLSDNLYELQPKEFQTEKQLIQRCREIQDIDHIIFIAPNGTNQKSIEEQQKNGVLTLLRIVKTMIALGFGEKELDWTILTSMSQKIRKEDISFAGYAAIHGFVGSLAKEKQNWKIRLVDVDQDGSQNALREVEALEADNRGNVWGIRNGHWFRQKMVSLCQRKEEKDPFRQNGVYVVIGGAGSIGFAWSQRMMIKYHADIIWIGRRGEDEEIQLKQQALSEYGRMPLYISADVTKYEELKSAMNIIKNKYFVINGVLHLAQTANVGEISTYGEEQFYEAIASKVVASGVVCDIFRKESLDFLFFMSSINAYSKAPQQSTYSAACTFLDAFVNELDETLPYDVKSLNLGYFKNNLENKEYLRRTGYELLEDQELFDGIYTLLASSFHQLAYVKILSNKCLSGLGYSKYAARLCDNDKINPKVHLKDSLVKPEFPKEQISKMQSEIDMMQDLLFGLSWYEVRKAGAFKKERQTLEEIIENVKPYQFYTLWLEESLRQFVLSGLLEKTGEYYCLTKKSEMDGELLWQKWNNKKKNWEDNASLKAQANLVEQTVRHIPEIIVGKKRATEIMFPKSSMKLVENVYKNNMEGNYFNELVANKVSAYLEERIQENPNVKIRIFEIGAGTGSTSVVVFKQLKQYASHIQEYCYTDVSRAFLIHAQNNYEKENPYLTYHLFDVSKQLSAQGISPNEYDIVIAANCLHTTSDICEAVRNAKQLLKKNGLIMINEMNGNNLYSHLTFGMLEGWWLYRDKHLRIEGCPGINSETWKEILSNEGFFDIRFEADKASNFKQEVIVGVSDGISYYEHGETMHAEREIVSQEEYDNQEDLITMGNGIEVKTDRNPTNEYQLQEYLKEKLTKIMADYLRIPSDKIYYDGFMSDYGVDSILSVNLVKTFNKALGINMDSTTLFEYSTISELASFISSEYADIVGKNVFHKEETSRAECRFADNLKETVPVKKVEPALKRRVRRQESKIDLAIVGLSAAFPMANSVEEFWENVKEQKSCISEIPDERKAMWGDYCKGEGKYTGKTAGLLSDITLFDAEFFGISSHEASLMCPEQRLLLLHIWNALVDAGITENDISQVSTGLFVAENTSDYGKGREGDCSTKNMEYSVNLPPSLIVNKISYLLNLQGPSECCETGCSSVLVALQRAAKAILNGECQQSIVASANLLLSQAGFENLNMYGLISKDGCSKPFQDGASGFVRSEGVGAFILKPLELAKKDKDNIYAVLKGSSVAHGGKGVSFSAPNVKGMKNAMVKAYEEAGITLEQVSFIEAHGIGNALSDSAEISALKSAYQQMKEDALEAVSDKDPCYISSLKPIVGHSETASGLAAIIKVIMALKKHIIPGLPGFTKLSSEISLDGTPYRIVAKNQNWNQKQSSDGELLPRTASVNSYGLGGVNAHIVLQEYVNEESLEENGEESKQIIILSAKTETSLYGMVNELFQYVSKQETIRLSDLAYTLQIGRDANAFRFATVVSNHEELLVNLDSFIHHIENRSNFIGMEDKVDDEWKKLFSGDIGITLVGALFEQEQYEKLAFYWVKGNDVDWKKYSDEHNVHKLSVPIHPFELKSYWIPNEETYRKGKTTVKMIIANLAGLEEQRIDEKKALKDYGFDSFMLIPFLKKLQDEIHPSISLSDMKACKSIGDLILFCEGVLKDAEYSLSAEDVNHKQLSWVQFPELIRMNDVSYGRPIFWFHAALGGVESYTEIAQCSERPFYGIQAKGWTTEERAIYGVNNMAKYYLEIIETVQQEESYDLGGFCLGGVIAYEVAALLQKKGKQVANIVMIDSPDNMYQKLLKKAKPPKSLYKSIIYQTINMVLAANGLGEQLIDRNELKIECTEEQFLLQVVELAEKHGLKKSKKQLENKLRRNAKVQMAYEFEKYEINPLPNKGNICCIYFKNGNNIFQGNSKEHFELEDQKFSLDNQIYWSDWEKQFLNFSCKEVDAPNHLAIMKEEKSLRTIRNLCQELYKKK